MCIRDSVLLAHCRAEYLIDMRGIRYLQAEDAAG